MGKSIEKSKENELGRLILILANSIIKTRNHQLEELGLTAGQADSMHYFIQNDNSTVTDLKNHLNITHQTASGIVQRMVSKGLLNLKRSDEDARYQVVIPTEAGIRLEEKIIQNRKRTGSLLLNGMTEEEEKQFIHLVTLALENVKHNEIEVNVNE